LADIGAGITPIKIAIVGLGKIGARSDISNPKLSLTHASAISNDSRFTLVGGSDPNEVYGKDFERVYKVPSFESISELINVASPQAIVVASQTRSHIENLLELMNYPNVRFILCEKPISQDTKGLAKILRDASLHSQNIVVNYQRRTERESKEIRKLILEKKFGSFLGGTGFYSRGYFNNASHMLDLLEWWFDEKLISVNLVEVSSHSDDYEVSFVSKIGGANFFLNAINSSKTSLFEIYLEFEFCQLRYCSGGSHIFIDKIVKNEKYDGYMSIQVSPETEYPQSAQSLSSVYDDIFTGMLGGNLSLPSASSALNLINRMKFFINGKEEESC
jgi:predicted dehydrogenase